MAPPPADLRKIGVEGFALIDKFYGPSRRSSTSANDAFPGRRERSWVVHQVPIDEMEKPAMNSKEAAVHFGGMAVVNYPKGKPQNREPAMNSKEVGVHFGGMAVVNYPKGKPQNRWGRQTH